MSNDETNGNKGTLNTSLDINKIRDRTFNRELSDLVTRIKSNEPAKNDNAKPVVDITENELLQMFHDLFYKSVNLANIDKINTDFNPFALYRESTAEDLINLINTEMQAISLHDYSILAYNFNKKCYASFINHINNIDENNIIVDTSEDLYTEIIKSNNGIILDPDTIKRNSFLKKRFTNGDIFYFISFCNFFKDFYSDNDNLNYFSNNFFPILMIKLKEDKEEYKKDVYHKIKTRLTIYFFLFELLYKKIKIEDQDLKPYDLHDFLNFLDYEYQKHNRHDDCVCSIIRCKKYTNTELFFIINYLVLKLKKTLTGQSTIYRIEKDKFIVLTLRSNKKILDDIIENFNKLYDGLFHVEVFINDKIDKKYLLQDIKRYILK